MSQEKSPRERAMKLVLISQISIITLLIILFLASVFLHFNGKAINGDFAFSLGLGALGASIIQMKRIQKGKLSVAFSNSKDLLTLSTIMHLMYGMVMAAVAYLLFMSGILSGDSGGGLISTNLFPNFKTNSFEEGSNLVTQWLSLEPKTISDTGKLLVWSFIAGYSENFVSGVLKNIEKKEPAGDKETSSKEETA